ncbi:unnamed protein product [Caenorhabditis brenneri]
MLIELLLFNTIFISMLVGCKKKNEASKLKPRNLDKNAPASTPTVGGGTPAVKKASAEAVAVKKEEPQPEKDDKMCERPADDNETINDAKSNWGTV